MPKRIDFNQREIVTGMRSNGLSVQHLHEVGKGCPDLLIGFNGINYLVEIKDGSKPLSKQKLTEAQVRFHSEWKGKISIIKSLKDLDEFLILIGAKICDNSFAP
jgi:hypothetical protein